MGQPCWSAVDLASPYCDEAPWGQFSGTASWCECAAPAPGRTADFLWQLHPGLAALGAGLLSSPWGLCWAGPAASPGTWGSPGATFPPAGVCGADAGKACCAALGEWEGCGSSHYLPPRPIDSPFPQQMLQFSRSVVSDSLRPHGLQHTRPPCPSPPPGAAQTHVGPAGEPSNHLILCRPLLLPPSILPSITVFSNESVLCIRWPKYWRFSFSISPSNEYSGLISFRMDWFDTLAVQGTLKSLLQHHSSKASILWHSAFFLVQLSHLYMTTGKTFD